MKKVSLLYIDDEYINLLAFEAQFRRRFNVFCFDDALKAFDCLAQNFIDFVFSDQRMPKISGIEFLLQVRKKYPNSRRIIISGFIEDVAIKNGLQNGLVDIAFEKPYDVSDIENFIEKYSREDN